MQSSMGIWMHVGSGLWVSCWCVINRLHLPSLSWDLHNGIWLTCVTKRHGSVACIFIFAFR